MKGKIYLTVSKDGEELLIHVPFKVAYEELGSFNEVKSQVLRLTPRQKAVFDLLRDGMVAKEISRDLNCSVSAVKHVITSIYQRLQVKDRSEMLRVFGYSNGVPARRGLRMVG